MSPACLDTIYLAQLKMSQAFDHRQHRDHRELVSQVNLHKALRASV